MSDDNVHFAERKIWSEKLARHMRRTGAGGGGGGQVPPGGEEAAISSEQLAKLEGAFDSYQKSLTVLVVLVTFLGGIMIAGFTIMYGQVARVDGQIARLEGQIERIGTEIDALPQRLADEFRSMRAEMNAQTSALASAVTAARGSSPQVIVVPGPLPPSTPDK